MGPQEHEPSPVASGPRFLPSAIQCVLLRATLGDGSDTVLPNKLARLWFWNWRVRGHASPLSVAVGFPAFLRQYAAR